MLKLLGIAIKSHWDAHKSNKVNFASAVFSMVINNTLFLYGLWIMLFAGKTFNQHLFPYVLALLGLVNTTWGIINFCAGGLRNLATNIENGYFETALGMPRHPLLLTAISASNPIALGDILQGFINMIIVVFFTNYIFVLKMFISLIAVLLAFIAVFIIAGSMAFILERGSYLSRFIIDATFYLSGYPTDKIVTGKARCLLYLTPVLFVTILPMNAIEKSSVLGFIITFLASLFLFFGSIIFFNQLLKKYKSSNIVGIINE